MPTDRTAQPASGSVYLFPDQRDKALVVQLVVDCPGVHGEMTYADSGDYPLSSSTCFEPQSFPPDQLSLTMVP